MARKVKNTLTLAEIANAIRLIQRTSIIDIGNLLIQARAQCEHGQWLDWLETEFAYSEDTAERYVKVARLANRFRNLRNLKLGKTTLYALADHDDEADLPAIIQELAKHATKTALKPADAERVINIGIGRRRHGDFPDETLVQLAELRNMPNERLRDQLIAALKKRQPTTEDAAVLIINEIHDRAEHAVPQASWATGGVTERNRQSFAPWPYYTSEPDDTEEAEPAIRLVPKKPVSADIAPLDVSSLALAQIERAVGELATAIERGDVVTDAAFEKRIRTVADRLLALIEQEQEK